MSVLSRDSVLTLIKLGQLSIRPFHPEMLGADGSYTFTFDDWLQRPLDNRLPVNTESCAGVFDQARLSAPEAGFGSLRPGDFALLRTAERIVTGPRLYCWLSTHPRLAKLGLDVIQSSALVPPDSDCHLTLETSNRGPFLVRVVPGTRAVKAIFLRQDDNPAD